MEHIQKLQNWLRPIIDFPLFSVGETTISVGSVLYFALLILVVVYATRLLHTWVVDRILIRRGMEEGVREAIGAIIRYVLITLGFVIILQTSGVDLSALTVVAGAVGIGVGFGLQTIASNFISGIIILLERPIKVGDRIEVDGLVGDVKRIALRATTIITNDNISIIVPNTNFISSKVTNWSHTDRDVRFNFPVGVSYKSDPEKVKAVLLEVAIEHPGVLTSRRSDVVFEEFGDSSLNFILRVWSREYVTQPLVLRSELNFAIARKFKERGIEIPFPQRDLHLRSSSVDLSVITK